MKRTEKIIIRNKAKKQVKWLIILSVDDNYNCIISCKRGGHYKYICAWDETIFQLMHCIDIASDHNEQSISTITQVY